MKRIRILVVIAMMGCLGNKLFGQKMMAIKEATKDGYNFWLYQPGRNVGVGDSVGAGESVGAGDSETADGSASYSLIEKDSASAAKGINDGERAPLIIFLHGASLKGTDLKRVLKYGPLNAIDRGVNVNAYVMAPQTSGNWDAEKIWKCVEWVKKYYPIDTNRISVIGMSLGGFGTFTLAAQYYDKLSAGMMLCGGNTNDRYCGLTQMPFWIMHGTADKAVPISRSNSIVSAMAACGDTSRLLYTKLQGANHAYPAKLFYLTETYDWLTSHSLTDKDRAVNRSIKISQQMISGAYGRLTGVTGTVPMETKTALPVSEKDEPKESGVKKREIECSEAQESEEKKNDTLDEIIADREQAAKNNPGKSAPRKSGSSDGEVPYHIVQPGNTLTQIAAKYNTTVARLCELNGIEETSILQIGQKLKVGYSPKTGNGASSGSSTTTKKEGASSGKASGTSEKSKSDVQSKANPEYHTVVSGNTLYGIAKKYNTTVQKLCELNGIDESAILQLGQKIKLPKSK